MKQLFYLTLIFLMAACQSECEKQIAETNVEEALEVLNDDYTIYEGSKSYIHIDFDTTKIKWQSGIYNPFENSWEYFIMRGPFDSLSYSYDSLDLVIKYFHLSTGCVKFIPKIITKEDSMIIMCRSIRTAELECKEGKVAIQEKCISCKNAMLWQVAINKTELNNKKIVFKPWENEVYEIQKDTNANSPVL